MASAKDTHQENQHLECSVCFLPYNTSNHKPKKLPCDHSFCLECLHQLAGSQVSISCPQDSTEYPIPHGSVDNFPNNCSILSFLADLCADCGVRPKQKLCLEEHCSKYLCIGCRETHRQSFHSDLIAALTELEQETTPNHDDSDFWQLMANAELAVDEVTELCDELKQNLIDTITAPQEKSFESLGEWNRNLEISKEKCRIHVVKLLSHFSEEYEEYEAEIPDNVLVDTYKQMTEVKTELALKQQPKPEPVQCHYKNLRKEFDAFYLNLHQIITKQTVTTKPEHISATLEGTYGKKGSGVGEFDVPCGICVCPVTNQVAVVDKHNYRIHLLTDSLRPVSVFGEEGEGNNQYKNPWDVTITDRGVMFITDCGNHRIQAIHSSGVFLFTFGSEGSGQDQFNHPIGIASTHDHLYICDADNYRVKVTTHDGTYEREFGTKGKKPGQFHTSPFFIAVSEAHNKAVISDGDLYIFTLKGQFMRIIKSDPTPLTDRTKYFTALAFDTHSNLVVADSKMKQILILGEEDQHLATIELGQLDCFTGVAITPSGDIMVCDYEEHCVKFFKMPHANKVQGGACHMVPVKATMSCDII